MPMTEKTATILQNLQSTDIGKPRLSGSVAVVHEGLDVTGGGEDIWGSRDECHFAYAAHEGDFDLKARLESLTPADHYTKAGLMARESLDEASRHVFFQVFPDNGVRNNNNGGYELQLRERDSGDMRAIYPTTSTGDPPHPVRFPDAWVRLTRSGDVFTAYSSVDGARWTSYGVVVLGLKSQLLVGFAVTSHNAGEFATATFRSLTRTD